MSSRTSAQSSRQHPPIIEEETPKVVVNKSTNTPAEFLVCPKCQNGTIIRDYLQSVNYINSCHNLMNKILLAKQQSPTPSTTTISENTAIPVVPNFMNIFAYLEKNGLISGPSVVDPKTEGSRDVSPCSDVTNRTDDSEEARRECVDDKRSPQTKRYSSIPRLRHSSDIKIRKEQQKPSKIDLSKLEEPHMTEKVIQKDLPKSPTEEENVKDFISFEGNCIGLSDDDLDKFAQEILLASCSESPRSENVAKCHSHRARKKNRKNKVPKKNANDLFRHQLLKFLRKYQTQQMQPKKTLISNTTTQTDERDPARKKRTQLNRIPSDIFEQATTKLNSLSNSSSNTPKNQCLISEQPQPSWPHSSVASSVLKAGASDDSSDIEPDRDFQIEYRYIPSAQNQQKFTTQQDQNWGGQNQKEKFVHQHQIVQQMTTQQMNQSRMSQQIEIKQSQTAYVVTEKPKDFFVTRRPSVQNCASDLEIFTERNDLRELISESDIDDDIFEPQNKSGNFETKNRNSCVNVPKSILSNIGILSQNGKVKPEKEKELQQLRSKMANDSQSLSFRRPRDRNVDGEDIFRMHPDRLLANNNDDHHQLTESQLEKELYDQLEFELSDRMFAFG